MRRRKQFRRIKKEAEQQLVIFMILIIIPIFPTRKNQAMIKLPSQGLAKCCVLYPCKVGMCSMENLHVRQAYNVEFRGNHDLTSVRCSFWKCSTVGLLRNYLFQTCSPEQADFQGVCGEKEMPNYI